MFCTVGKGFIHIEFIRQFQYRGVICQDGCTLGEGISSAINRFIDIDMYVVPLHRWLLGSNQGEIIVLVGFCYIYSGSVIYRHDVIIYALRNQLAGKQMNLLLDGMCLCGSIIVLQIKILLVGTFQNILSILQWLHLIIGRITHLHLGRTIYITRIGTAGYRAEDVTVEDIHIGKSDDITLLTATIDEVGRYAASGEFTVIHRWFFAADAITHNDVGIAIYITLHTISGTIDVEAGVFRLGSQIFVRFLQFCLILIGKHVAPEVDGNIASHGSRLVAAAINATALVGILYHCRFKLVFDGQFDEWFL